MRSSVLDTITTITNIIVIVMAIIVITSGIIKKSFPSVDDIQIKEWTAPNKVDRCYVAYWPSGQRADIACVETDGPGD